MEIRVNPQTQETLKYFKKGSWYKGSGGDSGIIAKFDKPESNHGWWGSSSLDNRSRLEHMGTFVSNYFRLVTPDVWEEITDQNFIEGLEKLLSKELENEING